MTRSFLPWLQGEPATWAHVPVALGHWQDDPTLSLELLKPRNDRSDANNNAHISGPHNGHTPAITTEIGCLSSPLPPRDPPPTLACRALPRAGNDRVFLAAQEPLTQGSSKKAGSRRFWPKKVYYGGSWGSNPEKLKKRISY